MHEEWVRTGHAPTGKVNVAAAASIVVFVLGSFVVRDTRTIKLMSLGRAAAVRLDASVIRMLIVPALMYRLGRANWWLPSSPYPPAKASHACSTSGRARQSCLSRVRPSTTTDSLGRCSQPAADRQSPCRVAQCHGQHRGVTA